MRSGDPLHHHVQLQHERDLICRGLAVRSHPCLGRSDDERDGVLQGIVPRGGLEPSGNQVGGVEKRRQALARLERERAGKGSAPVLIFLPAR